MIEFDEKFWLALAFFILFIASFKFVKLRFKALMDARSKEIETKLFEAKSIKDKAANILEHLKNKEKTINYIIENIHTQAKKTAAVIIARNDDELESIKSKKNIDLNLKIENYQNQVSNSIKERAIYLSIQILKNFMSDKSNQKILDNLNSLSIKKLTMN